MITSAETCYVTLLVHSVAFHKAKVFRSHPLWTAAGILCDACVLKLDSVQVGMF